MVTAQQKQSRAIALIGEFEAEFSGVKPDSSLKLSPWIHEPLPLTEFMETQMRLPLWPRQREDLEAFLGATSEETKLLFTQNPPTSFNCGALVWGKGSGKDLLASAALVWFVHVLLCLRSPQQFLELEESEAIDLAIASPTLRQTRRITFTKFKNRLKNWEWLKTRLTEPDLNIADPDRFLKRATEAADFVELPNNIKIHNLPLNAASAEGFNLLAFILSEFAGMESEADSATASDVLKAFMSSGKTRYRKAWKGFLASFPRSTTDPQEVVVEQAARGLFPELYVVRRPTWEVHPDRTFEDFADDFARDPEDAWAKYGAQPRAAVENYFRSPELLIENASGGDRQLLETHFKEYSPERIERLAGRSPDPVSARSVTGDIELNEFGFPRLERWFRGLPGIEYYAHVDIGLKNDSTGIAIGHLDHVDGAQLPVLDLCIRWTASHFNDFGEIQRHNWYSEGDTYQERIKAAEIDLKTVTDFFVWLKTMRGFNFGLLSCDGFNSAQLMQQLFQFDIPCFLHTVDKSDFDEFKSGVYTRTLRYRCDRLLYLECQKLVIERGKVEAPRTKLGRSAGADSHKDMADAAASVAARLRRLAAQLFEIPSDEPIEEEKPSEVSLTASGTASEDDILARLMQD